MQLKCMSPISFPIALTLEAFSPSTSTGNCAACHPQTLYLLPSLVKIFTSPLAVGRLQASGSTFPQISLVEGSLHPFIHR